MKIKKILTIAVLIILSCKDGVNKENLDEKVYDENDYIKVQGIIVQVVNNFTYADKFKRDYRYIYYLDRKKPIEGVVKGSELIFDMEDPVAIMVNKTDSTDTFIGHRGIINEEVLVEYLTNPNSDYESWFDEEYLEN